MKKILFTCIIIGAACILTRGQTEVEKAITELNGKVKTLNTQNGNLKKSINKLNKDIQSSNQAIENLKSELVNNSNAIVKTDTSLTSRIQENKATSDQKISQTSELLSQKALYWIIVFLTLTVVLAVLFILLSRRQKSDKSQLLEQLNQARSNIETNLVAEFSKQTKLMETQLGIMETQAKANVSSGKAEVDHSLALKLADEINLIERNINLMDAKTKGIKQLTASVVKLKDNLEANNYEIPELLGKPFHQGMKVIVTNSLPDENLAKGEEVITRIIKPQVNFNDKMIQTAQIEVSVGY
jgi:hypothetical protein